MPTHRYPLADGREVEIIDPISEGRARVFLEGELLGEYTIHELKTPATFVLLLAMALVWMRHAAHAMDAPLREHSPQEMPRVTLT